MADCDFTYDLPSLQVRRQGESFNIPIDWDLCGDGITVSSAESSVERSPSGADTIIASTTISGSISKINIDIADDQAPGEYAIRHVVLLSTGVTSVQCFTIAVEEC